MRKAYVLIPIVLTAIILLSVPLTDGTSAEKTVPNDGTHTITGDVVLTEDTVFEDGSRIIVMNGAKVDISKFRLDLGSGSSVAIMGSADIVSNGGRIILGEDTVVLVDASVIPTDRRHTEYSFTGTVHMTVSEGGKRLSVTYGPSGQDRCIHLGWERSTMSVEDPVFTYTFGPGTADYTFDFTGLTHREERYDGSQHLSTRTTDIRSDGTGNVITVSIDGDRIDAKVSEITEISDSVHYDETDIVNATVFSDLQYLTMKVTDGKNAHVECKVGTVDSQRTEGGTPLSRDTLEDVTLIMDADLKAILGLILPSHDGDTSGTDILRDLRMTAGHADLWNSKVGDSRHFTDIVMTIDENDTANYRMKLTANEGDDSYTVTATEAIFSSFSLSRDLITSVDVKISRITVDKTSSGGTVTGVSVQGTDLKTSDLDLMTLYTLYSRAGRLTLQQLLDNSNRFYIGMDELMLNRDGDDVMEIAAHDIKGLLEKNGRNLNTFTLSFSDLEMPIAGADGRTYHAEADATDLYVESSGSMTECIDAVMSRIDFTSDAHAEIQLSNSGFRIISSKEDDTLKIVCGRTSASSPTNLSLTVSLDHSMYLDRTSIDGKVSATGYLISATEDRLYHEPKGNLHVKLMVNDLSGSFSFDIGEEITFSLNAIMPWSMDFYYYDIEFQADGQDMSLQMSRGKLSVDGYDRSQEGLVQLLGDLKVKDFRVSMRLLISTNSVTVYRDGRGTVYAEYSDAELGIRGFALDMKRDAEMDITLDGFSLSTVLPDGKMFERTISHLDVRKDLSGGGGDDPIHDVALYLAAVFVSISAVLASILVYLRVKRPELFRFNEGNRE